MGPCSIYSHRFSRRVQCGRGPKGLHENCLQMCLRVLCERPPTTNVSVAGPHRLLYSIQKGKATTRALHCARRMATWGQCWKMGSDTCLRRNPHWTGARKFACESFDAACVQCEHFIHNSRFHLLALAPLRPVWGLGLRSAPRAIAPLRKNWKANSPKDCAVVWTGQIFQAICSGVNGQIHSSGAAIRSGVKQVFSVK